MKILTSQQIRDLEQHAIAEYGISPHSLMQKAGEGVADAIAQIFLDKRLSGAVGILTGKGNNGGDGFSAALALAAKGIQSGIFTLFAEKELSKDARHFYRKAKAHKQIAIVNVSDLALLRKHAASIHSCCMLVDAILGTGFHGKPEGVVAEAIDYINAARQTVVAVDVPSGLDAATGQAGKAVFADLTVTMGFCKAGFLQGDAMNYIGRLNIVDIGIPAKLADQVPSNFHLLDKRTVGAALPRRRRISHKGTYGHVLVVGGSLGMTGAAILCARAALRTGSGLVTVACPASVQPIVASGCAEAMTVALPENADIQNLEAVITKNKYNAIVLGPGMGREPHAQKLIQKILSEVDTPMVVDADALNAIAANKFDLRNAKSRKLILTPHLGEFRRLTETSRKIEENHIWEYLSNYSHISGAIVVLKSHISAISNGTSGLFINILGNPGMATAGMGDVLSGIIGSFLGQGLAVLDAATAGAFVHATAGDLVARHTGFYGLIASDVIESIPQAILEIPLRR